MSRPVEIDRDRAFKQAYKLFWQKGYQASSMQDLLQAMDIGRSSFYAAFGSKEALFKQVVARYREQANQSFARLRKERKGLDVIRGFIEETLIEVSDRKRRMGCLAVNSVLEHAGVNPELHRVADEMLKDLRQMLEVQLEDAIALGQIAPSSSARELSELVVTLLQGWRVASRRGLTRDQARRASNSMFELLAAG